MASSRTDMYARFVARQAKRKPPRNFRVTGSIPGFGGYQQENASRKIAEAQARHDSTAPAPRYGAQRAPYQKGERFKRKNPYRYQRGDAARPHRPTLN